MSTAATAGKASAKKKKKTPPRIEVKLDFCKGCGICVAFCPTQVLAMENGKVKVVEPDKCIGCLFCELRCPDFAIAVYPTEGS
ncbi:MAG: 4Fe-4S binding protein [Candidatus Lernaella stagnicola]|nr:4Fe-4S binding protein [Candidatus Lernaella stagnicola]